jgi:electron transport complex protein RnfG
MNTEQPVNFTPQFNSRALILVLGLVAMLSGLLIVTVYQVTLPTITAQKHRALEAAVLKVIPGAVQVSSYVVTENDLLKVTTEQQNGLHLYAGYDTENRLQGIAIEGSAQGYADAVKVLYGYSPQCRCINGFIVVASRETPGFGERLSSDRQFLANFNALDAQLNPAQNGLAHAIVAVKHGHKQAAWEIDAISGATISSRAAARALNDSASQVLPLLHAHLEQLQQRRP